MDSGREGRERVGLGGDPEPVLDPSAPSPVSRHPFSESFTGPFVTSLTSGPLTKGS